MATAKPLHRRRSLRWLLLPSVLITAVGLLLATSFPQYGAVVVGIGISGVLLAAVVLGLSVLGSRRERGGSLRAAP